jgi:hypothetical protein
VAPAVTLKDRTSGLSGPLCAGASPSLGAVKTHHRNPQRAGFHRCTKGISAAPATGQPQRLFLFASALGACFSRALQRPKMRVATRRKRAHRLDLVGINWSDRSSLIGGRDWLERLVVFRTGGRHHVVRALAASDVAPTHRGGRAGARANRPTLYAGSGPTLSGNRT